MGKIVLLDELTINQIAAGEVIERPASVVKEMVENSIDAGAKNINIEIKNGGISYIRITDDGKGIMPDDMEIAFERHATSKIRVAEDLKTVKSMGFRGEALASIASIANVEMISRTADLQTGNKIVVEAGDILEKQEIAAPVGTMITVTKLFFNTPVRYKFLKKDFTEAGYIEDAITRLALIHPEIAFKLISSGKVVIQTTGNGNLKDVIYSIYGKDVATQVLDVDYQYEDLHIKGVVGKPGIARSNRSNQLFFVNDRYIKDKTLSSAVEKSFKGMLPIGKYPFLVLNIEMDSSKVDVNVHPAKLEVRFVEEQKVFKAIYHSIKDTLLKNDLVTDTERDKSNNAENFKMSSSSLFRNNEDAEPKVEEKIDANSTLNKLIELQRKIQMIQKWQKKGIKPEENNNVEAKTEEVKEQVVEPVVEKKEEIFEEKEIENIIKNKNIINEAIEQKIQEIEPSENIEEIEQNHEVKETEEKELNEQETNEKEKSPEEKTVFEKLDELQKLKENINNVDFNEMYLKTFGKLPSTEKVEEKKEENSISYEDINLAETENISVFEDSEVYKSKPFYKFIGIAFKTYIIIEMDKEMYIIDQHAAHERIMYEKVKKNFYKETEKDSQLMILPDIITLTHKEMNIAKDNLDLFEKAGFIIEEFGENTIKISGTPSILLDLDTKELFLETLDEINTVARTAKQEIEERFIATVACKAAVKAHMALTKEEVDSLMDKLLELPNPFTCPHGRPTAIKMTKYDIERKFARKQENMKIIIFLIITILYFSINSYNNIKYESI